MIAWSEGKPAALARKTKLVASRTEAMQIGKRRKGYSTNTMQRDMLFRVAFGCYRQVT